MPRWPPLSGRWNATKPRPRVERTSPAPCRIGLAELQAKGGQSLVEAALHGHRADLESRRGPAVTPSLHHHPAKHLLAARVQVGQEVFHPRERLFRILLVHLGGSGELLQQGRIERSGTAQLFVTTQEPPLLHGHPQARENLSIQPGLTAGFRGELFLQASQAALELALTPGQPYRGRRIPQVVQNRPADVGTGKGGKRGLLAGAIELRGSDQAQQAHLDQIVFGLLAATPIVSRQGRNQVAMVFDQAIAALQSKREA